MLGCLSSDNANQRLMFPIKYSLVQIQIQIDFKCNSKGSFLFFHHRDMAGLIGLAAVLLGLYTTPGGLWSMSAAPWVLALLGWAGIRGVILWRLGSMQRSVHTQAAQLQALVHNGKMLTGLSRKALRLVQETEVISRGFTL